jgi:hypothetical protein
MRRRVFAQRHKAQGGALSIFECFEFAATPAVTANNGDFEFGIPVWVVCHLCALCP